MLPGKEAVMASQIYYDLREKLDQFSVGFPATESGVELRILERLFREDEAALYLHLSMVRVPAEKVAQAAGLDLQDVSQLLDGMVHKGLVFKSRKGDSDRYAAVPYVVGIYEHQLKTMDQELAELTERYFQEAFGRVLSAGVTPLRTIPVNASIDYSWPVAPYEDVRKIIRSQDTISVADCMCRVHQGILGKACDSPVEVCFAFGAQARYYVESGLARWTNREEALTIIDRCEEAGLVPQPFNAQEPSGLCNCCGDCCDILRSIKMHPKPAERVISNYTAVVDADRCTSCETCVGRCQMEAISVPQEGTALVNKERCIGCGLCVTTCPSEAVRLHPKGSGERREPPAKGRDTMLAMAAIRRKSAV